VSERPVALAAEAEIERLRAELARLGEGGGPKRFDADPEEVQRSVARLVLSLVEFVRRLLERQAIRRMEGGSLTPDEVESMGLALMRLEETVHDLAGRFGLSPEDLGLDLGPLGRLF
jgi:gas vesicle protein GvpK